MLYDHLIKRKPYDHNARTTKVKPVKKMSMTQIPQVFESFLNDGVLSIFEQYLEDDYDLEDNKYTYQ